MAVIGLLVAVPVIARCSCPALGQAGTEPAKWAGAWVLNLSESKIGPFLMPGIRTDFAILGQTLTLEKAATAIRLSRETTFRAGGGNHSEFRGD
jgi:hypothetical protein